eukprot:GHVT01011014.1.p1 GENE.GHVT01011014.1~~GHVT01011014.1.p1  ORF type:complete len:180 (+),score=13.99 GHVT01011014.1:1434-1973(+)
MRPAAVRARTDVDENNSEAMEKWQVLSGARSDLHVWLDHLPLDTLPGLRAVKNLIGRLRILLEQELRNLDLLAKNASLRQEIQLTCYPANTSGYLRHLDADADCRRFVTAVLYLNPSWPKENGGQLEVVTDAGTLQLLPEADKLIIFRSDYVEHQVCPVLGANRYAVSVWFSTPTCDSS